MTTDVTPGEPSIVDIAEPWLDPRAARSHSAYLDFIEKHMEYGNELSEDELEAVLAEADHGLPPERIGLEPSALRAQIIADLNLGFLLDGLQERVLAVSVLGEELREGYTKRKLLFWDPEVGSFEALLFLPRSEGPHPGIIGLHGHRDSEEVFASDYLGAQLAGQGFDVLLPKFRVHDCSRRESEIARELLRHGFTLMGMRVYETLLTLKYLRHLDDVDEERIGIISHSGGSSTANLVLRISDGFVAQVTDYQTDFRNHCGLGGIHCETVPSLVPIASDVNDLTSLTIPHMQVKYGFPGSDLRERILAFFEDTLRARRPRSGDPVAASLR